MTVAELIEKLEKVEDKTKEVWIYSYDDWSPASSVFDEDDNIVEII